MKVCFSSVEVREYEFDLCDNPSCSLGPAIGLGWNYEVCNKQQLDEYEALRPPARPKCEMKMTRDVREKIVANSKFSKKEITKFTLMKARIADGRMKTKENMPFSHFEEKIEGAKRKFKRIVFFKEKDAELKKIWPEYNRVCKRPSMQTASTCSYDYELPQNLSIPTKE